MFLIVLQFDRGRGDPTNIIRVVLSIKDGTYEVETISRCNRKSTVSKYI